jgi:hypothetical protein
LKRLGRTQESAEAFKAYEGAQAKHSANQRTLLVNVE